MAEKRTSRLFISRAGADADIAAAIGAMLEAAGHEVILQQWDFANHSFMARMHAALSDGARVVALLSPEYLRSEHCQAEWQNAIAQDPLNKAGRLVLLRVVECEPPGLLSGLAYWDLVPIRDQTRLLRDLVIDAVREERGGAAPSGPYWRAPRLIFDAEAIRPTSSFTGREEVLASIAVGLNERRVAAVHGLGGVGKSSLAREYAWRHRDYYSVIWWLNAETESGIIDGLLKLGVLFVRGLDQLADRRAAAQQVTSTMLSGFAKPVLLVFDNLDDERLLGTWLPRSGAQALATSRSAAWSGDVVKIGLETWSRDDASAYLQRESGRSDLTPGDAGAIADTLGMLPLALAHASAYLRGTRTVTPGRYLARIGDHLAKAPVNAEYPRSVFATFTTAIAGAEKDATGAAALLAFAARFAPDAIPDELFRQPLEFYRDAVRAELPEGAEALDLRSAIADEVRVDEALGALDRLSLVSFSLTSRTYSIHRLVQIAARDLAGTDTAAWTECAVTVADAAFPLAKFETWAECERLLAHARAAMDGLASDSSLLAAGRLAEKCGAYLWEHGEYAQAEPLFVRALAIRERALGPDHLDVATSLNELAVLYEHQGRYAEAEPLYLGAIAIREKALGPDDPDLAESLNDLAVLYQDQGRYADSEPLHLRALAIKEKTYGHEDRAVAVSLSNLANLYERQGRAPEAEARHLQALPIFEKCLGSDHPEFASGLNNLAFFYQNAGRFAEAEPLHVRALAGFEKTLGPDHPYVAHSLNNLAFVYHSQGRYAEAEPLRTRALAIREKTLGPNHPDLAPGLSNLANWYEHEGRVAEAESLLQRALGIREKALGNEHPDVARTMENLASFYQRQGRYSEAEPLYARVVAVFERALGAEHPSTAAAHERLQAVSAKSAP